jgi:hypothetical protein
MNIIRPGHTKKRPGQPETARVMEITPVVLEYCLNRIFIEIIYGYIIVLNKVLFKNYVVNFIYCTSHLQPNIAARDSNTQLEQILLVFCFYLKYISYSNIFLDIVD